MRFSHNILGAVASAIAILAVVGGVVYQFTKMDFKIDLVDYKSETRTAGLSDRLDDLNKNIDRVDKNINRIYNILNKPKTPIEESSSSPISLTEYGVELGEKISVDSLVEKYQNFVNVDASWSEYQIQQHSFDFVESELLSKFSDDDKKLLEKVAFDEGLIVPNLMRVIAIKMRDKKLEGLGRDLVNIDQHTLD